MTPSIEVSLTNDFAQLLGSLALFIWSVSFLISIIRPRANANSSAEMSITARSTRQHKGIWLFAVAMMAAQVMLALLQFGPSRSAPLSTGDMASIAVSMQLFAVGLVALLR